MLSLGRRVGAITALVALVVILPATPAAADDDDFFWTGGDFSSMSSTYAPNWDGAMGFGDGDDTVYVETGIDMDIDGGPVQVSRLEVSVLGDFGITGDPLTVVDQLSVLGYGLSIDNQLTLDGTGRNGTVVFVASGNGGPYVLWVTGPVVVPQISTFIIDGTAAFGGTVTGGTINMGGSGSVSLTGGGSLDALNVQSGSVTTNSQLIAPTTVSAGATLSGGSATNTGGEQTVSTVALASAAVLSPGAAPEGTDEGLFAVTGDLTAEPGAVLRLGAGAAHDAIAVGGTASVDGARIELTTRPGLAVGTRMPVLTAGRIDGRLAHSDGSRLDDGAVFVQDGWRWRIRYDATSVWVESLGEARLAATGSEPDVGAPLAVAALLLGGLLLRRAAQAPARRRPRG